MEADANQNPRQELERLEQRKRRLYIGALLCGVAIILLSWVFRAPGDPFLTYLYPLFAGLLGMLVLVLWFELLALPRTEALMMLVAGGLVLGRLGWHHHAGGAIDQHLLVLVGGHYWAVGALIVGAFVMLDRRRGLLAGAVILLVSAAIAATGAGPEILRDEASAEALLYLVRVHVFLLLLLILVAAVAGLRDRLHHALVRAEMLDHWARTDMLTGLANRRAADAFLNREIASARRYQRPLSVMIADIDHFKRINDTHGHNAGDAVIREVAQRFTAAAREADLVARWGGEEFLIIAPETDLDEAVHLAERCRTALAEAGIDGIRVTATFGVTRFHSDDTLDSLVGRADRLLYRGKAEGRNRVVADEAPQAAAPPH